MERKKENKRRSLVYKIEDVMLEIERIRNCKVEEYANSRKMLGSKIR